MDHIIRTGDTATFIPQFGKATVTVAPTTITGSASSVSVVSMTACVDGDESTVILPGVPYISGNFVIPGTGTVTISQLGSDQLSKKTKIEGKAVIVKGTTFDAKFQVMSPAQQPSPSGTIPDPVPQYSGKGSFVTTNATVTDGG